MSSIGELTFFLGLQVKQKEDGIFISQDKYVAEILKKFDFASVKTASTPIETEKPLVKDEEAADVDVHLYRSMIGSLMYLTASRPDIMFALCTCSRYQVTPKTSHLHAMKRIFRKSTTEGCQFLHMRLISWQCKKQTIVATSTTEAEYVAAANYCGQVLWIQNQMLDYRLNFMNTQIYIDNESTICIVKNLVFHSKTKHIAIRHHFIRDAYEKKLIQVLKIHTNDNVADLLTKAFDVSSSIYHAFTVSPPIYNSYIEQFWNTASSQTINDVKQIDATVDSKAVVVTEASIRSSLLFNDADGTACLTNEAIFQNLALMGYEGDFNKLAFQKAPFSPQWKFLIRAILHCLSSKSTSWNEFSTNIASAVICLATNQKFNFSKLIFDGMLRNLDNTKKKFFMYPRVLALESIKDAQAVEINALKSKIKKLEKKCKPSISHHKAWLKSVKRLSLKKRFGKKESISKQGRKKSKPESTLDDSIVFDDQDADHGMEYMETEEAVDEGRQSGKTKEVKLTDDTEVIAEDKGSGDKGGSAEELVSTARPEVRTAGPDIDATKQEDSAIDPRTPPTTTSIFDDEDITMAQTLIKMKEEKAKEKGVSIKDVDDSSRPARSILTLKPLLKIDPKDKGKGVLKESPINIIKRSDLDAAQIAKDAEIARLALYIKEQERDTNFVPSGSKRDEKMIDKINKKDAGMDEEEVPEEL
ncbi:hypothetical protein Tco_0743328 [Tanacetum coccineum]